MTEMLSSYRDARERLNGRSRRHIARNTWLEVTSSGEIVLILHRTAILTFRRSGAVVYRTGGWQTITTKERLNRFGPLYVYSQRKQWRVRLRDSIIGIVADDARSWLFAEGLTYCRGRVCRAEKEQPKKKKTRKAKPMARFSRRRMLTIKAFIGPDGNVSPQSVPMLASRDGLCMVRFDARQYSVTHVATTLAIGGTWQEERQARLMLRLVLPLADWTLTDSNAILRRCPDIKERIAECSALVESAVFNCIKLTDGRIFLSDEIILPEIAPETKEQTLCFRPRHIELE
jgi:hypothetical protein